MMPPSRDVSIIGFADLEPGMFTDPALSSVHQSGYQMGATGAGCSWNALPAKKDARHKSFYPPNCASVIP
jgi:DNA-binding LacI/PurR family transcriptional regulator